VGELLAGSQSDKQSLSLAGPRKILNGYFAEARHVFLLNEGRWKVVHLHALRSEQ